MPFDRVDFRNNSTELVQEIFRESGLSAHRLSNFKKAFREQPVKELGALKRVKLSGVPLSRLPFSPLLCRGRLIDGSGNEKFVFETSDGHVVESVVLAGKRAPSVCISVQIGCRFRCAFCRTGRMGFKRNLMPSEMLEQVRQMYQASLHPQGLRCVSFMGMGEPFDNLDHCETAFNWMRSDWGWTLGAMKITFSTLGALNWERFFRLSTLPNLAVSLHSASEEVRRSLMPHGGIGLDELKARMLLYTGRTKKRISIAYCLFDGVNDSREDAEALSAYLRGVPCKVNVMRYNPVDGSRLAPSDPTRTREFSSWLEEEGLSALHRKSYGVEIGAGCGQLGGLS